MHAGMRILNMKRTPPACPAAAAAVSHPPPHRRQIVQMPPLSLAAPPQSIPPCASHSALRSRFPIAHAASISPSRSTTTDRSAPSDNSDTQHLRHPCAICTPFAASPNNTSIEMLAPPHPLLEVSTHSPSHIPHFSPARPAATVRAASTPLAPHDCHARCALRPHLDSRSALSTPAHARARRFIGPAPSLETARPYPDSIARRRNVIRAPESANFPECIGEVVLAQTPIRGYPRRTAALAALLDGPDLPTMIRRFIYSQEHPDIDIPTANIPIADCPLCPGKVKTFPSAVATFYTPSDQSGVGGMYRECIRAVRSWWGGAPGVIVFLLSMTPTSSGFAGCLRHHVSLCASYFWFCTIGDEPCPDVGMWMVEPDLAPNGEREMSIIHLDTILRAALKRCTGVQP
ncbi:hypothetical protein B0H13DRAFT_2510909 [Mycena leptocephala]|nr:hypothetical protein B0H13DRAFT_2510909 [Mycena leptocephala]